MQKKNKHKKIIQISLIILVLTAAYLLITWQLRVFPFKDTNLHSNVNSEPKTQSYNQETIENVPSTDHNNSNTEAEKDLPTQYEGENPNISETLTGSINYKSVIDNKLVVRVTINQLLSSGSCTLRLARSSDQKIVTKQAAIIPNPSSATCEGFDVPVSELGSGQWSIEINITSSDRTGTLKEEVTL